MKQNGAKQNGRFRHESLQDQDTIKDLLKSITAGIGQGRVTLSDGDGSVTLEPSGLLRLKINATTDDDLNKLDIRITWQGEAEKPGKKALKVK